MLFETSYSSGPARTGSRQRGCSVGRDPGPSAPVSVELADFGARGSRTTQESKVCGDRLGSWQFTTADRAPREVHAAFNLFTDVDYRPLTGRESASRDHCPVSRKSWEIFLMACNQSRRGPVSFRGDNLSRQFSELIDTFRTQGAFRDSSMHPCRCGGLVCRSPAL